MTILIIIILVGIIFFFVYFRFRKNFKFMVTPCVTLITGAPKTGKDLLMNNLAQKDFKSVHRRWSIRKFFHKLLKRNVPFSDEEPLFYCNYACSFGRLWKKKPHKLDKCIRKLTNISLRRMERFNYKSIISITEASLVNDNQNFNDQDLNIDLSLFYKLIGHETRGGKLYCNTQSILDLHYAPKRVACSFYWIQKNVKFLFGLFHVLYVREMISADLGQNNFIDDTDTTTRKVMIPFWWHNRYDCYEFSYFTDDLECSNEKFVKDTLVSFNSRYISRADKRRKEIK